MREIACKDITDTVAKLAIQACCHLPCDMVESFRQHLESEPSAVGKNILQQLLDNADIADRTEMPICQDTGLAVIFADIGQDVHITGGDFTNAINEGVRRGYVDGYLRKSSVAEPLFDRKNTGDNTPAVLHVRIVPGDRLTLRLAPKGAGSENKSVVKMLVPADGIEGVKKVVLDAVKVAGPNSCPPMVIGVGLGGSALCSPSAPAPGISTASIPIRVTRPSRRSSWRWSIRRVSARRGSEDAPPRSPFMWNGLPPTSPPCLSPSISTATRPVTRRLCFRRAPWLIL